MNVVIFGTGAIGGCLGGWLSEVYDNIFLLDQGEIAKNLKEKGLTLYKQGEEANKKKIAVKVIDKLSNIDDIGLIAIAVKNYSLEGVAKTIKEQVKSAPIILGLQNGIANQTILPKYFDRVVFSIIEFNAWIDEPGVIGYQNKGPFVLGTLDNVNPEVLKTVSDLIGKAVRTIPTERIRDAAYCKMVINLTNSFTTLVGFKYREISSMPLFKKMLSNSMYEGVKIIQAAGIKEFTVGDMPSWSKIKASATLPDFITMNLFKRNLDKMVLSSMAQDVIQRKSSSNELDSLLGHFVELADQYHVPAPYNKAVYELCKTEFTKENFTPLTEEQVWAAVQKKL